MIYSGDSDESVGHCFVCDGYDGEGLYHFNWGWGGYLDGYFLLSALMPDGMNFSCDQYCIINFYPSDKEGIYGTSDGTFLYTETGNGTLALTGVAGSGNKIGGDVVLPDETTINGTKYTVTSMWRSFSDILDFENLTGLDIWLPITSIPAYTFMDVTSLKSIKFPSTFQLIGRYAFAGCSGLTGSLTIPNAVTSIGEHAFAGCSGLTGSLTIPNAVNSIGEWAFRNCSGLTGSLTIPNSVTSIGEHAFEGCSGLTGSLTIPNAVTYIGEYAFRNCSGLTGSLTIPNAVTSIGAAAFAGCSGFTGSLTIPNSVTYIGEYAFEGCSGLTGSLTIPNAVTSIGEYAFYNCSGFTGSLTVPNAVNSIGEWVFGYCSGLTGSLTIPNTVTSIGNYAFYNCSGLTGSLTIPSAVTSIGEFAFRNCSGLTGSLTIPNSVTSIGSCAFYGCSSLTSVTIPNSVTSIGHLAFRDCISLVSVILSDNLESISSGLFYNCKSLEALEVPGSVKTINTIYSNLSYTFYGCSNLNKLILAYSSIPLEVQYNWGNWTQTITDLYIDRALQKDIPVPNLEKLEIGENVEKVQIEKISQLEKLTTIYSYALTPPELPIMSNKQYMDMMVYVPEEAIDAYRNADSWKNFWNLAPTNGINEIEIDIDSNAPAQIYSINGMKMRDKDSLPAGVYILRQGNISKKIIIR